MSFETIVFGFIEGATGRSIEEYRALQELNEGIIAVLPDVEGFPAMNRSMFSATGLTSKCGTHRAQVIHFGASYRGMEAYDGFDEWLERFESVLRVLYWFKARVHFVTEVSGEHLFEYEIENGQTERLFAEKPLPINAWSRRYLEIKPVYSKNSGWIEK